MQKLSLTVLYLDLYRLPAPGKRRTTHLNEILEIVAVLAGIKPAHLNGEGEPVSPRIEDLEGVAARHGLLTLRTKIIKLYQHRKPRYDPAIERYYRDSEERETQAGEDVLWIYKDAPLLNLIHETVAGKRDVSKVLGYSECCVRDTSEDFIRDKEFSVETVGRLHNPRSPEEYFDLLERGVSLPTKSLSDYSKTFESNWRFPYIETNSCPSCLKKSSSPASKLNRRMRDLAFEISESFGREIWKARYEIVAVAKKRGGDEILKLFDANPERNALCPCTSGQKYKRCCGNL